MFFFHSFIQPWIRSFSLIHLLSCSRGIFSLSRCLLNLRTQSDLIKVKMNLATSIQLTKSVVSLTTMHRIDERKWEKKPAPQINRKKSVSLSMHRVTVFVNWSLFDGCFCYHVLWFSVHTALTHTHTQNLLNTQERRDPITNHISLPTFDNEPQRVNYCVEREKEPTLPK